jgi:hypothetical protein
MTNPQKTIFISADHGLAIIYFLQSDVVKTLLEKGIRVILLTDDGLIEQIQKRFAQPDLVVEGLRNKACQQYAGEVSPALQWWSNYARRVGTSKKINTEAMDSHMRLPYISSVHWVVAPLPRCTAKICALANAFYSSHLYRLIREIQT